MKRFLICSLAFLMSMPAWACPPMPPKEVMTLHEYASRSDPGLNGHLVAFPGIENRANNDGDTALHLAAANGQLGAIRVLLASSADPNLVNNLGQTPAYLAIIGGHRSVLEELVNRGGAILLDNPLVLGLQSGHVSIMNYMLDLYMQRGQVLSAEEISYIVEHIGTSTPQAFFHALIAHPASVITALRSTRDGQAYLDAMYQWAVDHNYVDIRVVLEGAGILLRAAAVSVDPPAAADVPSTALGVHYAAPEEHHLGALPPAHSNPTSFRPIHLAARGAQASVIVALLAADSTLVNIADNNGDTPLHHALRTQDEATFVALLDAGANLDVPNNAGVTVRQEAADMDVLDNHIEAHISAATGIRGSDVRNPLHAAAGGSMMIAAGGGCL